MKFKSFVSSVAIAFCSFAASAATTAPVQVNGPSFSDIQLASLTLTGPSSILGSLGFAPYVLIAPGFQIALPSVSFQSVSALNTGNNVQTFASLLGNDFSFANLAQGTYDLRASGTVNGVNFIGAQFTVTQVPEPETFAMLLAGLGVVGAFARRRKAASASGLQAA